MKKTMRCHPGVSYPLERVVPEGGTHLCGTHLAAGTIVRVNLAVLYHNKSDFGGDAATFRPERWIESDDEKVKLMDRHLMTVSVVLSDCYTRVVLMEVLVRLRIPNMYWGKHFYHGDGQVSPAAYSTL